MSGISLANLDIGGLFSGLGSLAKDIRTAVTGKEPINAEKAAELLLKAQELETGLVNAQVAVNLAEASNANLFVSGWRPFIGWTCGFALAYNFIGMPLIDYFLKRGMPALDIGELITILLGMLGLGGMRSIERIKGKA